MRQVEGGIKEGRQSGSRRCSAELQFLKRRLAKSTCTSWEDLVHNVSHQNRESEAKKQDKGKVTKLSFNKDRILSIGYILNWVPEWLSGKESACQCKRLRKHRFDPWVWKILCRRNSCLENPMDRGAWWAAVHGVAKSRTQLSDWTHTCTF